MQQGGPTQILIPIQQHLFTWRQAKISPWRQLHWPTIFLASRLAFVLWSVGQKSKAPIFWCHVFFYHLFKSLLSLFSIFYHSNHGIFYHSKPLGFATQQPLKGPGSSNLDSALRNFHARDAWRSPLCRCSMLFLVNSCDVVRVGKGEQNPDSEQYQREYTVAMPSYPPKTIQMNDYIVKNRVKLQIYSRDE